MKKFMSIFLALVLCVALAVPAFAADVKNTNNGVSPYLSASQESTGTVTFKDFFGKEQTAYVYPVGTVFSLNKAQYGLLQFNNLSDAQNPFHSVDNFWDLAEFTPEAGVIYRVESFDGASFAGENCYVTVSAETPAEPETPAESETPTEPEAPVELPDVEEGDWYYDSVQAVMSTGIVEEKEDGTYDPSGVLTWNDAVRTAVRLAQYKAGETVYTGESVEFDSYLIYAMENGILVQLPEDGTAQINRGEAVTMFYNVLGEHEKVNTVADGYFVDVAADHAAHDAIYALAEAGICNGMGGGRFEAEGYFTRAQVATLVARMAGLVDPAKI